MKELKDCKKGILFTVGFTFLTLVVLSLAILIFNSSQESEGIVAKLSVLDRVYELDTSIGQSLGEIVRLKSGILIDITDNSVSFEEILPNENRVILNSSLYSFKQFIEVNLSNVNLSITNMEEMPLTIKPADITYRHREDWSDIEVLPMVGYSNGYSIFISTDRNVTCSSSFNAGGFNLSYEVRGDAQSCAYTSEKISPADDKQISVDSPEEGNIIIIKVYSNGMLSINLTEDISVTARTSIPVSSAGGIVADSLGLYVDFGNLGVSKEKEVKII